MPPRNQMLTLYIHQEIDEEIETPNAMYILTLDSGNVTLDMFLKSLPVTMFEKGSYSYRFKAHDDKYGYVWKDISSKNNHEKLPIFNGIIYAKILNLNVNSFKDNNNRLKFRIKKSKLLSNDYSKNSNINKDIKNNYYNHHNNKDLNFYADDDICNTGSSNSDYEGNGSSTTGSAYGDMNIMKIFVV